VVGCLQEVGGGRQGPGGAGYVGRYGGGRRRGNSRRQDRGVGGRH